MSLTWNWRSGHITTCVYWSIFFHLKDRPSEGGAPMEQEGGAKSPAASKVLSGLSTGIVMGLKMYGNDWWFYKGNVMAL